MHARTLDDLLVYKKAVQACAAVSELLEDSKVRNDFELRAQLASASAAVAANIAEGFGQQTDRLFVRYLFIARGSAQEMRAHLAVVESRRYVKAEDAEDLARKYEEIARMLTSLIRYLRESDRRMRT